MRFYAFAYGLLLALAAAWAPGGLIHRGQRAVNPKATPALTVEACILAGRADCWQNSRAHMELRR